jgi:seryl-tRNA synthetase
MKQEVRLAADRMKSLEQRQGELNTEATDILLALPNHLDDRVPMGKGDDEAVEILRWGEPRVLDFEPLPHDDLATALGILDTERAARMTGARFAVLKGAGAALERALINFFLSLHTTEHGYTEVMVPYLVWGSALQGTGQLPKFEADLFKIEGKVNGSEAYLIPTAEVPVTNLHREETVDPAQLPLKYACFTPCFRSEAGSYGRDTKGLIRQHQFHKVEMVQITTAEESSRAHLELVGHAERCLQLLGLPYRKVEIAGGDASAAAAYQIDLEVWVPSQGKYREISSCSNFWDYQARRMGLRHKKIEGKGTTFCHTINGSGLAVGRTLVAVLENYQQADGSVIVPEVLRPFMMGLDHIRVSHY